MKRSLVLGVILLTAAGGMASANVYVGLGVGTNGFEDSAHVFDTDGRALRLFGGYRFPNLNFGGAFSIEGGLEGYSIAVRQSANTTYDGREWFAAGKFSYPFSPDFDAYGRLGLQRTSLSGVSDFDGTGYLAGLGIELHINTPVVSGSLFLDFTRAAQTLSISDRNNTTDAAVDRWMLGFTVGF